MGTDGDCKSITSGVGVARRLYLVSRRGSLKKTGGLSRPLKLQAHLEPAARGGLHLGVEDHLASSLITGESRTVWTLPHTISRQAKPPCRGASPHRSSCAIQRCSSVVILLATATSRHLLTNRRQGTSLTRRRINRAKPTTLLGASFCRGHSPNCLHGATTHKSRLRQLA